MYKISLMNNLDMKFYNPYSGQDCAQIYDYGKWDDAGCEYALRSICEGPAVCGNKGYYY